MKTFLSIAAASVLLAAMLEFGETTEAAEDHAYLELALENRTGGEIDQTAIVLDTFRCTSGILEKGAVKTHLGWQKPVGTNAVVQWREGKQTKREAVASLANIYKPSVNGRLVFTIMPANALTNVVVRFEAIERSPPVVERRYPN